MARLLTIPQPHDTLSPAQRKFNQLQKQIEATRQQLDAWQAAPARLCPGLCQPGPAAAQPGA
ncbi:MAG: hypothetical protein U1E77_11580 [Inhella sp.]